MAIPFRDMFWLAGALELAIGIACLRGTKMVFQTALVAWLATIMVVYRFGLYWVDYKGYCNCLGNLTGVLHIPPHAAESVMKIVLTYLLMGSYAALLHIWIQKRRGLPQPISSSEAVASN